MDDKIDQSKGMGAQEVEAAAAEEHQGYYDTIVDGEFEEEFHESDFTEDGMFPKLTKKSRVDSWIKHRV